MLNEYLYEIITLIVILTSIVIYFLTRRFKQEELNLFEQSTPLKKSEPSNPDEETTKIELTTTEESEFKFEDQEEGIFGTTNSNSFEENISSTSPIKKSSRQKVKVPPHGKISKENFKDFKGVKLLIAEDNVINQKVIKGLLNDSGIETTMADDGQVALDILEKNNDFDIILMDAHMPRVDGFEATRIIRDNPKYEDIVVVALSGDTALDDKRKMTEAGMQEQLEKPLRMDDFYDILYSYTQGNEEKTSDDSLEVIMTKELNGDKGLKICGGDEAFYKDILFEFTSTYSDISQRLVSLLNDKEIAKADALLLDFVGITANIGADKVRTIALDLKESIKDLEEKSYITILDDLEVHLNSLLNDIKAYK